MGYESLQSRAKSSVLIPDDTSKEIIKGAESESAALAYFRRVPVSTNQKVIPVLSALPYCYWISPTDTGKKQTTDFTLEGVNLNIEELAAIIPVPEAVLADVQSGGYSLFQEVMPLMRGAAAQLIDEAVFFGTNKPTTFPAGISDGIDTVNAARLAANASAKQLSITRGTNSQSKGGVKTDLDLALEGLEDCGYTTTANVADLGFKSYLRRCRDTTGQKIFDASVSEYEGAPITWMSSGWPTAAGSAEFIMFDRSMFFIGIRKDITVTFHTDGVIQNEAGTIVYNLMQQDMIAMRMVMRVGWAMANPANRRQATSTLRYPAAKVISPAA